MNNFKYKEYPITSMTIPVIFLLGFLNFTIFAPFLVQIEGVNFIGNPTGGYEFGALSYIFLAFGIIFTFITFCCFGINDPNQERVVTLFGDYKGVIKKQGWIFVIPFSSVVKTTKKLQNFETQTLKVNDKDGNPIDVSAVYSYHIGDSARATLNVENFEEFLKTEAESALRSTVKNYAYDGKEEEVTLKGDSEEVAEKLVESLQKKVNQAGIRITGAKFNQLAYSEEIAQSMLKVQQAKKLLEAKEAIVQGAVEMVEGAYKKLDDKGIKLDEPDKARGISNLLCVICSDSSATTVVPLN